MACRSLVVGIGCDGDIGRSCQCAEENEKYSTLAVCPEECRGGKLFIYLEPISSFSSLYAVPHFTSMTFSYPCTTCLLLPLRFPCLHWAVGHISCIVPVVGSGPSAHSLNGHRLSCLEATGGYGENGRNFWCNVGATQPRGICLPPPFRESTQMCGFDIFNSVHYG